jgi:hypothetical protein
MFLLRCLSEYRTRINPKFSDDFSFVLSSEKIQRVQEKSNELWRYQRFWLIYEIKDKTVLPPPFNILCYLGQLIKFVFSRCKSLCKSPPPNHDTGKVIHDLEILIIVFPFLEKPTEQISSVDNRQINREKVIAESYWQHIFNEEKQNKT